MNTKRTRLVAGVLSAMVLSAPLAMAVAPNLTFTHLQGTLHVRQGVPCGGVVDVTTSIADGRMDITPMPARGTAIGGGMMFNLTRLNVLYTPFSVRHECSGIGASVDFREIGVQLASPVTFTGEAIGPEAGLYRFSIPKEQFLIFHSVVDNEPVQQPQTGYRRPSEDVTGVIDLRARTAQLHVVLASRLRFRAGCVGGRCLIDEEQDGTQTSDIAGIIPDQGTDTDADGAPDLTDNCPLQPNRTQSPVPTPVIRAPADVTLNSCLSSSIGTAQAVDVCNARPVVVSSNAPAPFAAGPNLVTWSGNDGIDPIVTAQQTVTITDGTAPTVSCNAGDPPGARFKVTAVDDCAGPTTLTLGSYALTNGEVIQLQQSGKPGVRLLGTVGPDKIRHFQVGKGQGVVQAADRAGNVASVACR